MISQSPVQSHFHISIPFLPIVPGEWKATEAQVHKTAVLDNFLECCNLPVFPLILPKVLVRGQHLIKIPQAQPWDIQLCSQEAQQEPAILAQFAPWFAIEAS